MFTVILYIILLAIFFIISGLILRYTVKFNYLSPRFKYTVAVFALLAGIIIIFSIYFLMHLDPGTTSLNNSNSSSGDLNF